MVSWGDKIAYHSAQDGNWEIYVMNSDGSNAIRITDEVTNNRTARNPHWGS